MPRYNTSPPSMFIDNASYRGDDRRATRRVKTVIPAMLMYGDKEEFVKVVDLSEGGCAWIGHLLVNVQATVSMQFYLHTEEGYFSCQPIHGRIVHVHRKEKSKEKYLINCDFKGIVFEEHGISKLIEQHKLKK